MIDILNDGKKSYIKNGDFVLIDGVERLKQHIIACLCTMYSDWILDPDYGIDYEHGLKKDLNFLESDVRRQISEVEGVLAINNFKLDFDKKNLAILISANIESEYGFFTFEHSLNYEN